MKTKVHSILKIVNYIALALPFVISLGAIYDLSALYFAIMSLIITGLLQLIIALIFLTLNPKNRSIKIYFGGVVFFFYMFFFVKAYDFYWIMPFFLCIYLTLILNKTPFFNYNFQ